MGYTRSVNLVSWDLHIGWFVLSGAAIVAMVVLPRVFRARPLSVPIVYVAVGYVLFELSSALPGPRPLGDRIDSAVIEYVSEFVVIVSLVGAGLRIDRRPGLARWNSVWRLLAITMVATVASVAVLGWWLAGLAVAPAILLGGVLAPTDPVLADDVQIGRPGDDEEADEVRFTLTAEAGLNDGLAFPVIHLAIAVTSATLASSLLEWAAYDLAYRVAVGAGVGWLLGLAIDAFGRRTGEFFRHETSEGLLVVGATMLVYGVTETVNGYGFLAVFVAALVRNRTASEYRRRSYDFVEQIESILVAVMLLGFGALLSEGILGALTWRGAAVAVALVLVVRPLFGWLGLLGRPMPRGERLAIAFFGIRGIGSLYYLAYATNENVFDPGGLAEVWAVTALAVVVSIAVHGVTATPWMRRLDEGRRTHGPGSDANRPVDATSDPSSDPTTDRRIRP